MLTITFLGLDENPPAHNSELLLACPTWPQPYEDAKVYLIEFAPKHWRLTEADFDYLRYSIEENSLAWVYEEADLYAYFGVDYT